MVDRHSPHANRPDEDRFSKEFLARKEKKSDLVRAAERRRAALVARDSLIDFTRFTMPSPEDPDDVTMSEFEAALHHYMIAKKLEEVERGGCKRLIVTMPPRHGKTELASRRFAAWYMGRNPRKQLIFTTYNQEFADDGGGKVREIMNAPEYPLVFPGVKLKRDSQARGKLETDKGGIMFFVGAGGALTGRGADLLIIDDPLKGREEAESEATRRQIWDWFTSVAYTRLMPGGAIIIILCMVGDTKVMMADGSEKSLRDIHIGDKIGTYVNGRLGVSVVKNWKNQGADDVFEIRTESGATTRANERHPFLVERGGVRKWVRLKNLRPGDALVRATRLGSGESGSASIANMKTATGPQSAVDFVCRTTINPDGSPASDLRPTTRHLGDRQGFDVTTEFPKKNMTECSSISADYARCAASRPQKIPEPIGAESCASITVTIPEKYEDCCATTAILPLATEETSERFSQQRHTSDFTLDKIVRVTSRGREDVFDIQVAVSENFIADGFVSHNTRWHEDDIVGRIMSNPEIADQYEILSLPAIAEDDDAMGRKNGEALWPEWYPADVLEATRKTLSLNGSARDWASLYQQRPTPDDGDFFKREMFKPYQRDELPENLRKFGASDHAIGQKQKNDRSCLGVVGFDEKGDIWILPDIVWERLTGDQQIDAMIRLMKTHKPQTWWAEKGHITSAIGPALRRAMFEQKVPTWLQEKTPSVDKRRRAASIRARAALRPIRVPAFMGWWEKALAELLAFDNGRHDDFVDWLAWIGIGLETEHAASPVERVDEDKGPPVGTGAWVVWRSKKDKSREAAIAKRAGW